MSSHGRSGGAPTKPKRATHTSKEKRNCNVRSLQAEYAGPRTSLSGRAAVQVSDYAPSELETISKLANDKHVTFEGRQRYLSIFLDIYRAMHFDETSSGITVAPRREGTLFARELGLLSKGPSFLPHMKRIPLGDGLAVGIEFLPDKLDRTSSCRIVDGAIASGATVITLMDIFSSATDRFDIYTVHCTQASVNALLHYGAILQKEVIVHAGFVGGVLNKKFYAVAATDSSSVIVGDVGDMIAPLFKEC